MDKPLLFIAYVLLVAGLLAIVASAHRMRTTFQSIEDDASAQIRQAFQSSTNQNSQLHRLSSALLRFLATGEPAFKARFDQMDERLRRGLETEGRQPETGELPELASQTLDALDIYTAHARRLMSQRDSTGEAGLTIEALEQLKDEMDELMSLVREQGDRERLWLQETLGLRRREIQTRESVIHLVVAGVLATALLIPWLTTRAYRPAGVSDSPRHGPAAVRPGDSASMAVIAAGLAHEIRNPLTAMKARTFALKELAGSDSPAARQADFIDQELNRLERLVSDFLDFARPGDPVIESTDLAHLLEHVWQTLLPELKARQIDFRLDRAAAAHAPADRHQIHQVLLNLVRNASESCEAGSGRVDLTLKTGATTVEVKVRDNGAGIPEAARARLFEPFFSTKRNGTGLGLSIARRIARNHAGDLTFETVVGRGTTFTLHLPLAR